MFTSPTKGKLTLDEIFEDIMAFMGNEPEAEYKIIIGSDSRTREDTCFVTAIIIHQVGKGARYYYRKHHHRQMSSLRQKVFFEAALSLETASSLTNRFAENGRKDFNLEIHLDVGARGDTKDLIREIVGMVTGSGFDAKIKPDSCGASSVADKHTK